MQKARLLWHCRRGMLELDLILQNFCTKLDALTDTQLQIFEKLLEHNDTELYSWLMGHTKPNDKDLEAIIAIIQSQYPIR